MSIPALPGAPALVAAIAAISTLVLFAPLAVHAQSSSAEVAASAPDSPLAAAITGGKSLSSLRLRHETVQQDGKPLDAQATTLRSLLGWQTHPLHALSVGAQLIHVAAFNDAYDNGALGLPQPGKSGYPRIADPDFTAVNQLYVDWTGMPGTRVRAGRQSVKLDNVRFIGNVEFRQVMQVFDGVSLESQQVLPDTTVFLAQFDKLTQVSTARQDVSLSIINARHALSATEQLVGYGYFLDWQGTNLRSSSTRTLGLRLDGTRELAPAWKLLYTAEYAKQSPYAGGSSAIDNHYTRLGTGARYGAWFARLDQEVLSSNGSKAFQTPLGTNHLFQGWADLLLVTPTEGIRDTFVTAGSKHGELTLQAEYHWLRADRSFALAGGGSGRDYGRELDVSVTWTRGPWSAKFEVARFREGDPYNGARKRDTDKVWLTGMISF